MIKKVIQNIYKFDFSKCELQNKSEILVNDNVNEFNQTFRLVDNDKGIIVTPEGYKEGLVYRSENGGLIASPASWTPDVIKFSFNILGLKKGAFYRVTVKAKNVRAYNSLEDVTDDRTVRVTTSGNELVLEKDLTENLEFVETDGFFRAKGNEENLKFKIGKIAINDIIIDEVEMLEEQKVEEKPLDEAFSGNKFEDVAYAIFNLGDDYTSNNRYAEIQRLTGKGLNLYFDQTDGLYILERDNLEDYIKEPFTNVNFILDFNLNKAPKCSYEITNVESDISPNTIKQGFIKFKLLESGQPTKYIYNNARLVVFVKKIS